MRGNRETADDDVHDIVFVQKSQQWLRVQCLSCHAGVQLLPPLRPGWQEAAALARFKSLPARAAADRASKAAALLR